MFDDYPALKAIVDPRTWTSPRHVLVLRNAGPQGGPGMPEWGMLPIPKAAQAGVRDMLRLSDARMSGTSYGACVLHVRPRPMSAGPLALVHTGDMITVDVPGARIHLEVDDAELARRRAAWTPPPHATSAATAGCSRATSSRPTRAATSTSSKPASAPRCPSPISTD
jgi:dihydroxyacid dehydratase/phosphogluconate dehydratase